MNMQNNRRRDTDYGPRACAALWWLIGAALAGIAVTLLNGTKGVSL